MQPETPHFAQDPEDPDRWVTIAPVRVGRWEAVEVATSDGPPGAELLAWLEALGTRADALELALGEELLAHYDREHFLGLGVDASRLPDERAEALAAALCVESIEVEDPDDDTFELGLGLPWDDAHLVTAYVVDGEVESISFDG